MNVGGGIIIVTFIVVHIRGKCVISLDKAEEGAEALSKCI